MYGLREMLKVCDRMSLSVCVVGGGGGLGRRMEGVKLRGVSFKLWKVYTLTLREEETLITVLVREEGTSAMCK